MVSRRWTCDRLSAPCFIYDPGASRFCTAASGDPSRIFCIVATLELHLVFRVVEVKRGERQIFFECHRRRRSSSRLSSVAHYSLVMAAAPQFAAPFPPSAVPVVDDSYTAYLPSFLRPVGTLLDSLDAARDRLNLPEPGKYEDLGREVKREYCVTSIVHRASREARERWRVLLQRC